MRRRPQPRPAIVFVAQARDAVGNVSSYGYDGAGRLSSTTDALGATTVYTDDAVGNTTSITTPLDLSPPSSMVEHRSYDAEDQLIQQIIGGSGEITATVPQTTSYSYDYAGNLIQQQAPNGDVTYNTLDLGHRLT